MLTAALCILLLAGSIDTDGVVVLAWPPNPELGVTYCIYRAPLVNNLPGQWTKIGTTSTPGFTDTTVMQGHDYFYAVSAVSALGTESEKSEPSEVVQVRLSGLPGRLRISETKEGAVRFEVK